MPVRKPTIKQVRTRLQVIRERQNHGRTSGLPAKGIDFAIHREEQLELMKRTPEGRKTLKRLKSFQAVVAKKKASKREEVDFRKASY